MPALARPGTIDGLEDLVASLPAARMHLARMSCSCCEAVRPSGDRARSAGRDVVLQAADAHLEELVEPRGEDGEELHPLEKRE